MIEVGSGSDFFLCEMPEETFSNTGPPIKVSEIRL